MPSEQFERKLRARLEHAQVQPRPELWEAIAQQVAEQSADRRGGLWIWLDGILGLLLISLFLLPTFQYHSPQKAVPYLASEQVSPVSQSESRKKVQNEEQSGLQELVTSSELEISSSSPTAMELSKQASAATPRPPAVIGHMQAATQSSVPTVSHRLSQVAEGSSSYAAADIISSSSLQISQTSKVLGPIDRLKGLDQHPISISQTSPDAVPLSIQGPSFQPTWILSIAAQGIYSPAFGFNPFAPATQADLRSNFPRGLGGDQQIEDIYAVTFPRSGFVARIGLAYQVSPRLSIESGIGFSRLNQGQYRLGSLGEEAPIGPTTPDPFITYEDETYQFQQSQIEIPLHLNFALTQGLHRWIISGGIALNHQLAWKVQKSSSETLLNEQRNILSTNQSLVLGQKTWYPILHSKLLYQRQLSTGMALSVGPVFRYQLQGSYTGSQSIGQSKMNAGLELGIQIGKRK